MLHRRDFCTVLFRDPMCTKMCELSYTLFFFSRDSFGLYILMATQHLMSVSCHASLLPQPALLPWGLRCGEYSGLKCSFIPQLENYLIMACFLGIFGGFIEYGRER